jgi:hypothetical protein
VHNLSRADPKELAIAAMVTSSVSELKRGPLPSAPDAICIFA